MKSPGVETEGPAYSLSTTSPSGVGLRATISKCNQPKPCSIYRVAFHPKGLQDFLGIYLPISLGKQVGSRLISLLPAKQSCKQAFTSPGEPGK